MKKIYVLILSAALCMTLTACSGNQAGDSGQISEEAGRNPSVSESSVLQEAISEPMTESPEAGNEAGDMYEAYMAALENLRENHLLPDGNDLGFSGNNMDENKFAVLDVDNDGKEELIIMYTTTASAGMAGCVLAYDSRTKELRTQLNEFPLLTFYDNGVVKAEWSHNQGLAGDFWPYNLYRYEPESDDYVLTGVADAWDKKYWEKDFQGNPFPDHIDSSGTGVVYYMGKDGQYQNTDPSDESDYKEWIGSYIGDASEIMIQYKFLTEENISLLTNE